LERERKTEEALQIYSQVLERDPKYAEARIRRADIYAGLHRFDEAIEDYKTYVSLRPDAPEAHDRLGRALVERNKEGDLAQALIHLNDALRLDPNFHPALYNRARLYARGDQPDKAIEDYERAVELNPAYPENPDEASRLNAEFAAAYFNHGLSLKNLGETAWAVEDFEQAKRLKPGDAAILNNLAALYAALKDYGRAVENYELAHRAEPQNVEALRGLGESYAAKGEHAAAVESFKKALELLPPRERGDVYVSLGASYVAQNMTREAREALLIALREGSGDARLKARRQLENVPYDAPASDAEVYIRYDSSVDPELVGAVMRAVAGKSFPTPSVSPTEQKVEWVQVRYFHKQDKGNADKLVGIVAEELKKTGEAWDVRRSPFLNRGDDQNFGHIEVFISAPRPTVPPVLQGTRPEN
jgi:tetratricopeptide (TPR) repeat protein